MAYGIINKRHTPTAFTEYWTDADPNGVISATLGDIAYGPVAGSPWRCNGGTSWTSTAQSTQSQWTPPPAAGSWTTTAGVTVVASAGSSVLASWTSSAAYHGLKTNLGATTSVTWQVQGPSLIPNDFVTLGFINAAGEFVGVGVRQNMINGLYGTAAAFGAGADVVVAFATSVVPWSGSSPPYFRARVSAGSVFVGYSMDGLNFAEHTTSVLLGTAMPSGIDGRVGIVGPVFQTPVNTQSQLQINSVKVA